MPKTPHQFGVTFVSMLIWITYKSAVKLMSMASFSLPCSALLISSKLYDIASLKYSKRTPEEKQRLWILELFCITVLPVFYSLLTLVSQGHRFNIVYGRGCEPAVYFSSVSIVIDYGIPVSLCITSLVYSGTFDSINFKYFLWDIFSSIKRISTQFSLKAEVVSVRRSFWGWFLLPSLTY